MVKINSFALKGIKSGFTIPSLSGDNAKDVAAIAKANIGKTYKSFGYPGDWCAWFATDCSEIAGVSSKIVYMTGGTTTFYNKMINTCNAEKIVVHEVGGSVRKLKDPEPGDYIIFKWNKKGYNDGDYDPSSLRMDHVAIVVAYDKSTQKLTCVGGNQDGNIESNVPYYQTSKVSSYTYSITDKQIARVIRPKYTKSAPTEIKVAFNRNLNSSDTTVSTETFKAGAANQKFGYKTDGTGNYSTMNAANIGFGTWSKKGYEMLGWNTDRSATAKVYATYSGVSDSWIAENTPGINLYAIWKAKSYTVTFDANGGTCSTESKSVTYDSKYGTLPVPTRTSYTFDGWFTSKNGSDQIKADDVVSLESNTTLYAKWTSIIPSWKPYQFKGSGTQEDPYLISDKYELIEMQKLVNEPYYNPTYGYAHYLQTADIDLGNMEWRPIGLGHDGEDGKGEYNFKTRMFFGVYDGGNHYIYNLKITDNYKQGALFAYVRNDGAVIRNLVVTGNVKNSTDVAGGIIGQLHYGASIENCAFIGDVATSGHRAGGVVGHVYGGGTVRNCYHTGNVSAPVIAGGVVGRLSFGPYDNDGDTETVENCYHADGVISAPNKGVIVGDCVYHEGIETYTYINNCYGSLDSDATANTSGITKNSTIVLSGDKMKGISGSLNELYSNNFNAELNGGYPVFAWQAEINGIVKGDANCDGIINMADAVLIMQSTSNPDKYGLNGTDETHITEQGMKNADVNGGGVTNSDALEIQKFVLGLIKDLT